MIKNYIKFYYVFKYYIPRKYQLIFRRLLIKINFKKYKDIWPISESANKKPLGWQGWPLDKTFAFILTHDVESQKGHDRSLVLMKIEKELGFRSSFNFVLQKYNVSPRIRQLLVENNFEVGVHGLNHDGKLYKSEKEFLKRVRLINRYIDDWQAVGFRSPAMHHNLEWNHKLNILYDTSTFDTDPFEPQPDGINTIFPVYVHGNGNGKKGGYVELPYTVSQDFTVFILLKNNDCDVWKKKLDWIAKNGGMVLLNTHPDYMSFNGKTNVEEYPIKYYVDFLKYVKEKYANLYWHVLPKEIAKFWFNRNKQN